MLLVACVHASARVRIRACSLTFTKCNLKKGKESSRWRGAGAGARKKRARQERKGELWKCGCCALIACAHSSKATRNASYHSGASLCSSHPRQRQYLLAGGANKQWQRQEEAAKTKRTKTRSAAKIELARWNMTESPGEQAQTVRPHPAHPLTALRWLWTKGGCAGSCFAQLPVFAR
jgi:hypothetical protein